MPTRITRYCDLLLEAGWLAAAVTVPLYFNVYSSRVFEPDKIAVLRSIAIFMGAIWIVKMVDQAAHRSRGKRLAEEASAPGNRRFGWLTSTPLLLPLLALALSYLLSTALSVEPSTSLLGSYQRLQGTYTMFAYMLVALVVIFNLRRPDQIRRLVTFMLLVSLPIAFYGVLQHWSLDPLPWGGDTTLRVTSTMGNSIFVAAYLIMVVPLTLGRFIGALSTARSRGEDRPGSDTGLRWLALLGGLAVSQMVIFWAMIGILAWASRSDVQVWWLFPLVIIIFFASYIPFTTLKADTRLLAWGRVAGYLLLMLVQLMAVFFSQSRGPWLGLIAGLFVFGVIMALRRHMRSLLYVTATALVVLGVFLGVFNLPNSPLASLRDAPYIGRLGHLTETDSGTGKVRILIWGGAVNMITSDFGRMIVGYGPESMYVAYSKFYPADLAHYEARNATPDRSHNGLLDSMVTNGVIGLACYLFLIGSVLVSAWRLLRRTEDFKTQLLLASIIAVVTAHFVEIQTGIQIASTWTYLWLVVGLVSVLSTVTVTEAQTALAGKQAQAGKTAAAKKQTGPSKGKISQGGKRPAAPARGSEPATLWALYGMTFVGALLLVLLTNVSIVMADTAFKQSQGYENQGAWDVSVQLLEKATALAPTQDYYYLFLGRAYLEESKTVQDGNVAVQFLQKSEAALLTARRLSPLNTDHTANLGRLYNHWADVTNSADIRAKAADYLLQATRLSPDNAQLENELAITYSQMNMNAQALDYFQRSIKIDPAYASSYAGLGDVQRAQQDITGAVASYVQAIGLDPSSLSSDGQFQARLDAVYQAGMVDQITNALKAAIGKSPGSAISYGLLGATDAKATRLDEAIAAFQAAANISPNDYSYHKNLALLYHDKNDLPKARAEADKALALYQKQPNPSADQVSQLQALVNQLKNSQ